MEPQRERLVEAYRWMTLTRRVDEAIRRLWLTGKGVGGTFNQKGHEAISVAAGLALDPDDVAAPMHRDLGTYLVRGITARRLLAHQLGRATGVSRGRDANIHGAGDLDHGVIGFISHLPQSLPVAVGAAMAFRHRGEPRVALTLTGDGSSVTGLYHESLNLAALHRAPFVLVVENNQYAYSTPVRQHSANPDIAAKAAALGVTAVAVDGTDAEATTEVIGDAVARARAGDGPVVVVAETMRMYGHAIHDGAEYVPDDLLAHWAERDPVERLRARLVDLDVDTDTLDALDRDADDIVADAVQFALDSPWPDPATVTDDVYAHTPAPAPMALRPRGEGTYLESISTAIEHVLDRRDDTIVLGEDVGPPFGGAFKVTKAAGDRFGPERVVNMPMTEAGFIGAANGMALVGMRPIIEMQFADFITTGFDAIVQFAGSNHYRWGGAVPWVIRAPSDGGLRSGPFHSQNPEAWFVHAPGLKVVAPATTEDAYGLLLAAVHDNNPVVYFESKPLYRSLTGPIPTGDYLVPIGKAAIARSGTDCTVVTYGAMRHEAVAAAETLATDGIEVEVVDLRTLKPLDTETVLASVRKTSRALVVHPANRLAGVGAEVAATIADEAFADLDAPVRRLGGLDVPVPFSPPLEDAYRPSAATIAAAVRDLCAW